MTLDADLRIAQRAGGFTYAPLPSGGAILHLPGAPKPIHLRNAREVSLWAHGFIVGHRRAAASAQAALDDVLAEVAASAPC